ncbi:hypothetical protein H340_11665 [Streptomyces mobaraensis NBRC 13819 = DSM 40847]|uniref:Uncharacterized protein n=1 Tax=Streptomyces mobaraensis (strain ATCC 29032 / DSM 40847 / JCM 4168 / NBRC 13819 / NCIMB 11159 / IPCR 16-22) TaxID=1223523 RepID=M3A5H7_STRM1|nr:hypothetical protein H340_11665 [Streptomyces mobaraensis NBRC 13819 = DSM 40847]
MLDAVVAAVRDRTERCRRDAARTLLARAAETAAPDLVVVPATTLAALRRADWDVPTAIEGLAGAVNPSRRADRAADRAARRTAAGAPLGRGPRRGAAEPAPPAVPGDGGRRHLGFVSDSELGSALPEVAAISRAVGGRHDLVGVVSRDAAGRNVHSLCRAEGIPLAGGGGTDLRTGFARRSERRRAPTPSSS